MALFDYIIIAIIGFSALISLLRGFVREAFSLAVWLLAFWIAWTFFRELAPHLESMITTPSVRLAVAFTILMLASLVVGGLVNFLVIQLVERSGLSGSDRFIGMIFGIARGVLLVTILVLLAGLTPFPADPWWQESRLVVYFEELAVILQGLLPEDIGGFFNYAGASGETVQRG